MNTRQPFDTARAQNVEETKRIIETLLAFMDGIERLVVREGVAR